MSNRSCLLCGEMICACGHCVNPISIQGKFGICDTDLHDVFVETKNRATREVEGAVARISATDPRIRYLTSIATREVD